jgi:FAD/FMN-containing dehydrogenase
MGVASVGLEPGRDLAARTRGEVIVPGDPAYDAARSTFNGMLERRPSVIFRPADVADVAAAVRWAGDADLPIGVRAGGHSVAGHSTPDGAPLVDLSRWRSVSVDPSARTAEALGGSLLMDLDAATAAHGLVAPSGTFVDTGIAGLTLSGGISYIVATEGYACDALIGAQLVTADGSVVEVDEDREPDLLWALRGGGGNLGIVTRLRYRLTPIGRLYAGTVRYRGAAVRDVLRSIFDRDAGSPDELTLQAIAWRSEEDQAPRLTVLVTWRGDEGDGAAATTWLREHPAAYEVDVRPMSWLELQARNTPIPFGLRHYWKGHLVGSTPADLVDAVIAAADEGRDDDGILIELIHGQAHRIAPESAAFGGRRAMANVTALGIWTDAADDDVHIAWARRTAAAVEPWSLAGGGYLNYPEVDQTAARVAAAFGPEAFARLQSIKRTVDPDNRFRFNANIPPA